MSGVPNETLYIRGLNERARIKDLKKELYELFSPFGKIISVVAKRSVRMRGQAFIIFNDIESASRALTTMQGCILYKTPMEIHFARFKSDSIATRNGNLEEEKAKRLEEKAKICHGMNETKSGHLYTRNTRSGVNTSIPNKILFVQNLPNADIDVLQGRLQELFSTYPGFQEIRMVPGRPEIAFVEFSTELEASQARSALDHFNIVPQHEIRVAFAKK
jgi:U2 small nuclear ribonucleoprotein B''